mmetsp:Transcript_24827/g.44651  ORF Transcript_24827/g.44651 Transcript_24827/m.44651 type:complete len:252 (+) Transcript_24827:1668-2423(+)
MAWPRVARRWPNGRKSCRNKRLSRRRGRMPRLLRGMPRVCRTMPRRMPCCWKVLGIARMMIVMMIMIVKRMAMWSGMEVTRLKRRSSSRLMRMRKRTTCHLRMNPKRRKWKKRSSTLSSSNSMMTQLPSRQADGLATHSSKALRTLPDPPPSPQNNVPTTTTQTKMKMMTSKIYRTRRKGLPKNAKSLAIQKPMTMVIHPWTQTISLPPCPKQTSRNVTKSVSSRSGVWNEGMPGGNVKRGWKVLRSRWRP